MRVAITYNVIPHYGELSSLHFQYDEARSPQGSMWIHSAGQNNSSGIPWWLEYSEEKTTPDKLNEQTTRIILNLIKHFKIQAMPDFNPAIEGTTYELEFFTGTNRVKYTWLQELPSQWQDLSALLALFNGFMEAH